MRAVASKLRPPVDIGTSPYDAAPASASIPAVNKQQVYRHRASHQQSGSASLYGTAMFAAAFFLGYLPGILTGRDTAGSGSLLAAYYMDKQNFASWGQVFEDLYAGAFLQATLVLLFGFCALGMLLLSVLFALKGMYLGYCAAAVFAQSGAKGLLIHWLLTCLPDLSIVFLLFFLAACAAALCRSLLRVAFGTAGRGAAQASLYSQAKALVLRYIAVLALGALFCALGSGSAVFLAAILL